MTETQASAHGHPAQAHRPSEPQLPGSGMDLGHCLPGGHQSPWASWAPAVRVGLARTQGCSSQPQCRAWGMAGPGDALSASALPFLSVSTHFLQEALSHHTARGGGYPQRARCLDPTPNLPSDPLLICLGRAAQAQANSELLASRPAPCPALVLPPLHITAQMSLPRNPSQAWRQHES